MFFSARPVFASGRGQKLYGTVLLRHIGLGCPSLLLLPMRLPCVALWAVLGGLGLCPCVSLVLVVDGRPLCSHWSIWDGVALGASWPSGRHIASSACLPRWRGGTLFSVPLSAFVAGGRVGGLHVVVPPCPPPVVASGLCWVRGGLCLPRALFLLFLAQIVI